MTWRDHISINPGVLVGKPVLVGTRLSVESILERLADGWIQEDLLRSYPRLTVEGIQAVFAFATSYRDVTRVLYASDPVARGERR